MSNNPRYYNRYGITGTELEAMAKLIPFFAERGESIVTVEKFDAESVCNFDVLVYNKAGTVTSYRVSVYSRPSIESSRVISG